MTALVNSFHKLPLQHIFIASLNDVESSLKLKLLDIHDSILSSVSVIGVCKSTNCYSVAKNFWEEIIELIKKYEITI